jgi:hypothetical protein
MNPLIDRLSTVAAGCLVLASGLVFAQTGTTTTTSPERAQQINRSGANTGAGNIGSTMRHDATEGGTVVSGTRTEATTTAATTTDSAPAPAAATPPAPADTVPSATAAAPTPPSEPAVAAAPTRSARSDRN